MIDENKFNYFFNEAKNMDLNLGITNISEKEAEELMLFLHNKGYKWYSDSFLYEMNYYDKYKQYTFYEIEINNNLVSFGDFKGDKKDKNNRLDGINFIEFTQIVKDSEYKGWEILKLFSEGFLIQGDEFISKDGEYFVTINNINNSVIPRVYYKNGNSVNSVKILSCPDIVFIQKIKNEINWNNVPRYTKVQVRDDEYGEWENRYFYKYDPNDLCNFSTCGVKENDEFTKLGIEETMESFKFCRLHPSVSIQNEWYK